MTTFLPSAQWRRRSLAQELANVNRALRQLARAVRARPDLAPLVAPVATHAAHTVDHHTRYLSSLQETRYV